MFRFCDASRTPDCRLPVDVEVSLNYCSQNGGNLYRAPYYNGNLNIGPRIIGNLDQSPCINPAPSLRETSPSLQPLTIIKNECWHTSRLVAQPLVQKQAFIKQAVKAPCFNVFMPPSGPSILPNTHLALAIPQPTWGAPAPSAKAAGRRPEPSRRWAAAPLACACMKNDDNGGSGEASTVAYRGMRACRSSCKTSLGALCSAASKLA